MNSFIETLNQWGGNFLHFAWPMLWQSSLLIAALFVFDLLLRHRLRASIRYALWLVVLVKLCVPPTLALPTSPVWWLHKAPPPVVAKPLLHYTVTYDNGPLPEIPQTLLAAVVPPKPAMTNAAWLLAAAVVISSVLLLWLLVRWWQIARLVRRAAASERLIAIADNAQHFIGLNSKVQVKLTTNSMSPAVCGLFRPAILIPQSLAENFSDEQLRAVLLHELIHLRRRDVWLNFFQALLQIVYWWHPLVWLANARIRRVREEAVDDAVMLALREDAEAYAPTLLEVAKLALNRPLASLGLVGILESRHALRQRIERLVDFRPPRQAGLTLVSLLGILAFTAIAVPMGEAPSSNGKLNSSATTVAEQQSLTVKVNPEIFFRNLKVQAVRTMQSPTNYWGDILIELLGDEGVDCHPPHGLAFTNRTGEITMQNTSEQLWIFRQVIEQLNRADGNCELPLRTVFHRASVLIEGRLYPMTTGEFDKFISGLRHYSGGSSGEEWWAVPPEQFSHLVSSIEASGLKLIQRPRIQTGNGMPATLYVGNGTNSLELACKPLVGKGFIDLALESTVISGAPVNAFTNHVISKASAEDHGGVVLRMTNYDGYAGSNLVVLINTEIVTNTARFQQRLQAVIKRSNEGTENMTNLFSRHFRVDTNTFAGALHINTGMQTDSVSAMARVYFTSLGVDWDSPKGKSIFYSDGFGELFVRATQADLDLVENALSRLNVGTKSVPPPIQINAHLTNTTNITGILSDPNFRTVIHALEQRTGAETLTEPKVTTVSGRGVNVMDQSALAEMQKKMVLNEPVVQSTNDPPPQIHIKARFIDVPEKMMGALDKIPGLTNGVTAVLPAETARDLLKTLLSVRGVETLAEPEASTTSGRRVQMRATMIRTVVTNFAFGENLTNSWIIPETGPMETGPILDVAARVLEDGHTISVTTTGSLTTFFGYADPTNLPLRSVTNSAGEKIDLPNILPVIQVSRESAHRNVFDGQTVVLFPKAANPVSFNPDIKADAVFRGYVRQAELKNGKKNLVVLVTVDIVDPAGNRIHSEGALPGYYDDVKPYRSGSFGGTTTQ